MTEEAEEIQSTRGTQTAIAGFEDGRVLSLGMWQWPLKPGNSPQLTAREEIETSIL